MQSILTGNLSPEMEMSVTAIAADEKTVTSENKFQGKLTITDDSTDADTDCYSDADRAESGASSPPDSPSGDSGADSPAGDATSPEVAAQLPSLGSAGHSDGTCKRCCFFPKGRCSSGADCEFCHFEHEKRARKATSKKKREKEKKVNEELLLTAPPGLEDYQAPPGLEEQQKPEISLCSQLQLPKTPRAGPAPPPAPAPLWATCPGPAPPPAPAPTGLIESQPILESAPPPGSPHMAPIGSPPLSLEPAHDGPPLKVYLTKPFCPVIPFIEGVPMKKSVPCYSMVTASHLDPNLPAKKMIPDILLTSSFSFEI
eukprot:gnl/MRDRNA2_/MRDRNA2_35571_c0_seq1.p1 gnl/MRDRNA2_/MRDRNA2_35571_c0~~gnl/MRDRNA2_/MRDRNA2_35571_c0_seq1.p1  ORF type:complete len:314 (+),score=59.85 gnl/MRDRNA2_/MRDRNA2_35571_c0_seq1:63-1004(+)